jgi:hypothetical protein
MAGKPTTSDLLTKHVTIEANRTIEEVNNNTVKYILELSAQVLTLQNMMADFTAAMSAKTKKVKVDAPAEDGTTPTAPAAAAKKGGGKKAEGYSAWFKKTFAEDAAFRARIEGLPDVVKMFASIDADIKKKKTDSSRNNFKAQAIVAQLAAIAQNEYTLHTKQEIVAEEHTPPAAAPAVAPTPQ